jgi:hypothetical protein
MVTGLHNSLVTVVRNYTNKSTLTGEETYETLQYFVCAADDRSDRRRGLCSTGGNASRRANAGLGG